MAFWAGLVCTLPGLAADWPSYQHDIRRSGISPEELRAPLSAAWVFTATFPPSHAWGDPQPKPVEGNLERPRLRFDDAFHVVAAADLVYFGSSSDTKVYALDARTGEMAWEFFTEAPVRFTPSVSAGRLYVGSDDGNVYCLDATSGRRVWTFTAAPRPDRVLGNGKMMSVWPVRTSVLVDGGVAYFGAGVFPAEGLYLYAVDAATGALLWKNDTYGRGGNASVTPQGYLVASADKLFVPSGRAMPVAFSRADGQYLFQQNLSWRAIRPFGGTYCLLAGEVLYTTSEQVVAAAESNGGLRFTEAARRLLVDEDIVYLATGEELVAVNREHWISVSTARLPTKMQIIRLAPQLERLKWQQDRLLEQKRKPDAAFLKQLADAQQKLDKALAGSAAFDAQLRERTRWRVPCSSVDSMVLTRGLILVGGQDVVRGLDTATGKQAWSAAVNGKARGIAVANGRVLVTTDTGSIHCFVPGTAGAARRVTPRLVAQPSPTAVAGQVYGDLARNMLRESGARRGYALVLGARTMQLVLELAGCSDLMIYVVEPDAGKAAAARATLNAAGVYGGKVVVMQLPTNPLPCADFFANLIVCGEDFFASSNPASADEVLRLLKPCGGVAYIGLPWQGAGGHQHGWLSRRGIRRRRTLWLGELRSAVTQLGEPDTNAVFADDRARITRGALDGAGRWTHQYADAGNTAGSHDTHVRGPLGLLWFGEPGPGRMPSRHASAAAPLALGGRMFVQGEDVVTAYDAYNGLQLWQREIPGATRLGLKTETSNLAADDENLFVVANGACLRLDLATGKTRQTYQAPPDAAGQPRPWDGYLACVDGLLYGSTARNCVFAMDVDTGKVRWVHDGKDIMLATICISDGRLFFVERQVTPEQLKQGLNGIAATQRVDRLGNAIPPDVRLVVALDAETGAGAWERPQYVSDCVKVSSAGGELTTMVAHGVVLLCGQPWNGHFWREFLAGEFSRRSLIALSAKDGRPLWSGRRGYRSRPLIVEDRIIAEPWAYDLKTGAEITRVNPVTGMETKWQMSRPGHHCGNIAGAPNMLFFRSGSFGYCDLEADVGTAHWGGQRPGCWINFIPANGVVMVPEASSGCMCPYPLQCTTVFYPTQASRAWSMYSADNAGAPVRHLAVNFGAPGDRKAEDGTLWLAYPRPRRDRLVYDVKLDLTDGSYYTHGPATLPLQNTDTPWVYASGCSGLTRCDVPLVSAGHAPGIYTVRLGFVELANERRGRRVFDVKLQGVTVLRDFDVLKAAGGRNTAVVREFENVEVRGDLRIEFVSALATPDPEQAPTLSALEVMWTRDVGTDLAAGEFAEPMEVYNLGYWYAEFVRQQAGADIALVPRTALCGSGSADVVDAGPLQLGQLFARLEDKRVVKSTVAGAELLRFLGTAEVAERLNPTCPGDLPDTCDALYYAGLDVRYDASAATAGVRLEPGKAYTVASVWPFAGRGDYGRERPPLADARAAEPVPGLKVTAASVLDKTTWELLEHACRAGGLAFRRQHLEPRAEWTPWLQQIVIARETREQARLAEFAKQFADNIVEAGGIKWRLVMFDDFERTGLGPNWQVLKGGGAIKAGRYYTSGTTFMGCAKKVKAPVRIEFDARQKTPCDLTPFWGTADGAYESGYFIGFGSNANTQNKIMKRGGVVASSTDGALIVPNRWHHVVGQVLAKKVQLIVDGKLVIEYVDPDPVRNADMAGIIAWFEAEIDNVRIYTGE